MSVATIAAVWMSGGLRQRPDAAVQHVVIGTGRLANVSEVFGIDWWYVSVCDRKTIHIPFYRQTQGASQVKILDLIGALWLSVTRNHSFSFTDNQKRVAIGQTQSTNRMIDLTVVLWLSVIGNHSFFLYKHRAPRKAEFN